MANREVVKHFKQYLTDPTTKGNSISTSKRKKNGRARFVYIVDHLWPMYQVRPHTGRVVIIAPLSDDARVKFKKYINTLATTKTEGDDKFLILRPKYATGSSDPRNALGIPVAGDGLTPSPRQPPPYRPPPPVQGSPSFSFDSVSMSSQDAGPTTPLAPPRRRGSERRGAQDDEDVGEGISVRERTQKFNRMASVEDEISPRAQKDKKREKEKVSFFTLSLSLSLSKLLLCKSGVIYYACKFVVISVMTTPHHDDNVSKITNDPTVRMWRVIHLFSVFCFFFYLILFY